MNTKRSRQRQRLWRTWRSAAALIRRVQRDAPMCPGSLYLLRRQCGKPVCRCRQGELHAAWVVTRSEQGRVRLYRVPDNERAEVRRLTEEYRDWQRARAALGKRTADVLRQLDALAEERLRSWPRKSKAGGQHASPDH